MPPKRIKRREKLVYLVQIPNYENYVLSNYGEVTKFSTGKKLAVINNYVRITVNGKQVVLSVPKLLREFFPTDLINFIEAKVIVMNNTRTIKHAHVDEEEEVVTKRVASKRATGIKVREAENNTRPISSWRDKLKSPNYINKFRSDNKQQSNEPVSELGRTETFLSFVNRVRDAEGFSKVTTVEEASDWLNELHSKYSNRSMISKDYIY